MLSSAVGKRKILNTQENENEKKNVKSTSLPPHIKTLYPNAYPVSNQSHYGLKLVIGTQVSNMLVTLCIRLDTRKPPSVASFTVDFVLSSTKESLFTTFFLDEESLHPEFACNNTAF
ncbi:MAG: hypothetical protein EXX96DRAFT_121497 [Benjaminiella poitrasii]|nr:MAG: hypothetical protein EXX96DRAFT_121497 [Benjaminiella poitrasii]